MFKHHYKRNLQTYIYNVVLMDPKYFLKIMMIHKIDQNLIIWPLKANFITVAQKNKPSSKWLNYE